MGNTLTRRADIFEYCTDLSAYAVLLEKKAEVLIDNDCNNFLVACLLTK